MADIKNTAKKLIYESQESLYNRAVKAMNMDKLIVQYAFKVENFLNAAEMFDQIGEYKDAAELAVKCRELAEKAKQDEKEYRYQLAVAQKEVAKSAKGYEKAEKLFDAIAGYKDAQQQIEECGIKRKQLEKKANIKKAGVFCVIILFIVITIGFFMSPAWEGLKTSLINKNLKAISSQNEKMTEEITETETEKVLEKEGEV